MAASVFLTRPQGKNETMAAMLADSGHEVSILPALHVHPVGDRTAPVPRPHEYQLLVFVSGSAARYYLDAIGARDAGFHWPASTYAATVGWASARPLYDSGAIPASLIVHPEASALAQDSEALWPLLVPILPAVRQALIVRGSQGREWLGQTLERHGVHVQRYAMYERRPSVWDSSQQQNVRQALSGCQPTIFLLTSRESVDAVLENIRALDLLPSFARSRFVVVHDRIGKHLCDSLTAAGHAEPSMVKICSPTDAAIYQALCSVAYPDTGS